VERLCEWLVLTFGTCVDDLELVLEDGFDGFICARGDLELGRLFARLAGARVRHLSTVPRSGVGFSARGMSTTEVEPAPRLSRR
jgi:hypothetical protein